MNLKEAYRLGLNILDLKAVDSKLEVRLLLQKILSIDELTFLIKSNLILTDKQINELQSNIKLRNTGYPIAYILGYRHFWQDKFIVTEDVLIPRPETETLIEAVLGIYKNKVEYNNKTNINILDIGVGSGCIILSLVKEIQNSYGVGVDICKKALLVAKQNAKILNVDEQKVVFLQQNLFSALKPNNSFDIIVSNPPYIDYNDTLLEKEVRAFEPNLALFAENKGFYFYKEILKNAVKYLTDRGTLFLEIGINQKEEIISLSKNSGLHFKQAFKDDIGIDRVLLFNKSL